MSKFQRKLAEMMGEDTMIISVKEWDKLESEIKTLKDVVREKFKIQAEYFQDVPFGKDGFKKMDKIDLKLKTLIS